MGRRAPVPRYLCQVVKGRPGKPPSTGLRLAQISLHFRMPADGSWSVPSAPKYRDQLMTMLLQCYPPPPQGLFVPAEHRLAAALCLVCLTGLLVSLAVKLSRSRSWSLERRWPNAAGAPARVRAKSPNHRGYAPPCASASKTGLSAPMALSMRHISDSRGEPGSSVVDVRDNAEVAADL